MNSFGVSNCTYDGTSASANPLCLVTGTVTGTRDDFSELHAHVRLRVDDTAAVAGKFQSKGGSDLVQCSWATNQPLEISISRRDAHFMRF
jgi:hypothetical protein